MWQLRLGVRLTRQRRWSSSTWIDASTSTGDAAIVTNNHLDQDGSTGNAMVDPEEALPRRPKLKDLAAAVGFAVFNGRTSARTWRAVALADQPGHL